MKDKRERITDEQIKELASDFARSGKITGEGGTLTPLLKKIIEAYSYLATVRVKGKVIICMC